MQLCFGLEQLMKSVRLDQFTRYWLPLTVGCFWLLVVGVGSQGNVLAQSPTPDINTVPRPEDLFTPTPTLTPAPALVVTATAVPEENVPADGSPFVGGDTQQETTAPVPLDEAASPSLPVLEPVAEPAIENFAVAAQKSEPSGTVTVATLNVREAPNTTSAIIDQLVRGDQVTLFRQAGEPTWWYICCGTTNNQQGWVSAEFIAFDPAVAQPVATVRIGQPPLQVQLLPLQPFVWQGQRLTLQFTITNPKTESVRQVSARTDLPAAFRFLDATTTLSGEYTIEGQAEAGPVFSLAWPSIPPSGQATANVELQIAADVADGALLDLIAAVEAEGESMIVTGITVIMPPDRLPAFR